MSWPNEVNSCCAIGYPSRQILKPQTGTQIYDCKVLFCRPQENLRQVREKFVGILALTFSVLDPLQTSNQFMQLNVSLFAASEKVLMGKAYYEDLLACLADHCDQSYDHQFSSLYLFIYFFCFF